MLLPWSVPQVRRVVAGRGLKREEKELGKDLGQKAWELEAIIGSSLLWSLVFQVPSWSPENMLSSVILQLSQLLEAFIISSYPSFDVVEGTHLPHILLYT